MARARSFKPGFFTNEHVVELDMAARLLFIGLWTLADREGRMECRPKRIKMEIFPADTVDIEALLDQIEAEGLTKRYVAEGRELLWIPGFRQHQNPHKNEKSSELPPHPDDVSEELPDDSGNAPNDSRNSEANRADSLNLTPDSLNTDSKTGADAPVPIARKSPKPLPENGPAQQIVKAFCEAVGIEQPVSYPKAVGQAKQLADAGVEPGDIPAAVEWCRSQKWLDDGFDLGTIVSQADKWRAKKAKPADRFDGEFLGTDGLKAKREAARRAQGVTP